MGTITTVNFRNDTLFAVERDDGIWVAVTPICRSLGIDPQKQRKRIEDDPILSEGVCQAVFPSAGGEQETFCVRLDLVNGWLFTINEKLVRDDETRQRVLAYKRECHAVLFQHFHGKHAAPALPSNDEVTESENTRVGMVRESRQVFGTQAAAQLWFKLGLPVVPAMLHEPKQRELFGYDGIKAASETDAAA